VFFLDIDLLMGAIHLNMAGVQISFDNSKNPDVSKFIK